MRSWSILPHQSTPHAILYQNIGIDNKFYGSLTRDQNVCRYSAGRLGFNDPLMCAGSTLLQLDSLS